MGSQFQPFIIDTSLPRLLSGFSSCE